MVLINLSVVHLFQIAQAAANDSLIQSSIQRIEAIQKAWDDHWINLFESTSGLYLGINQFASIILVGTFIFFRRGLGKRRHRTRYFSGIDPCAVGAGHCDPALQQRGNAGGSYAGHSECY